MNQVSSFFRQAAKLFLVVIAVFLIQIIGYSNTIQAQAETVTPEASSYQAKTTETAKSDGNFLKAAQESLKETAENVREKLNLDEPIDPGTKEFVNDVEKSVEKTVKPVTGKESGYYQDNFPKK